MTFSLDVYSALGLVLGIILPAVVGLVTKDVTSATVKSLLLVALSALSGFGSAVLQAHQAGTSYNLGQGLLTMLGAFVLGVSTHYGVLKPTGASDALQAIGSPTMAPAPGDDAPPDTLAPEIAAGQTQELDANPDPADDGTDA